jgi:hypothetical protein
MENQDTISLRRILRTRIEEKQKATNANKSITWLIIVASSLVMLTFVRVTLTFSASAYRVDYTSIAQVVVNFLIVLLIFFESRLIAKHNMDVANRTWIAILILAGISTSILVGQNLWWVLNAERITKFTSSGLLVFYIYYLINNIFGLILLLRIRSELKHFRIHSKNSSMVTNALFFWIFLLVTYSLHIIILS